MGKVIQEVKKDRYTEIVCILDRSGSMWTVSDDALGGINQFIKDQKKETGKANLTLILFDNHYEVVYDRVPIKDVEPLDSYEPRGSTALLDAVGKATTTMYKHIQDLPENEKPDNVIITIMTDGQENDSKEYTKGSLKSLIEARTSDGWNYVYLSADENAFHDGVSIGIAAHNTVMYSSSSEGTTNTYGLLSHNISSVRNTGMVDLDTDEFDVTTDGS